MSGELLYFDFPEFFTAAALRPSSNTPKKATVTTKQSSLRSVSIVDVPKALRYIPIVAQDVDEAPDHADLEKAVLTPRRSSDSAASSSTITLMSSAKSIADRRTSRFDARFISDAIIGLSDGLTVPFALTAGLSALGDTKVVIFGGLAELTAGAISMGLGGYLGARSEQYVIPIIPRPNTNIILEESPSVRQKKLRESL